jgi:hypothetical protein
VTLVEQWNSIESGLDPNWNEAQLTVSVADESRADRAAALLGPANPGRSGRSLRLSATRLGGGVGPEAVRRMLRRLDAEKIEGTVELISAVTAAGREAVARASLATAWDAELAQLPSDWSDLFCELKLTSTDYLERAALLAAPLNPTRYDETPSYRFRCARSFGYGASPAMVRRCLERLDADAVVGTVGVVTALSDTHPVGTQGPVLHTGAGTI